MSDIENSVKLQIVSRKCTVHPEFNCDMLLLDPSSEKHRICSKCMMKIESKKKLFPIPDIVNLDSSQIMPIYPLQDSEELQNMVKIEFDIENLCNSIEEFYLDLQKNLEASIQKLIEKDCDIIKRQLSQWQLSSNKLKDLLSIRTFQELLQSQDINSENYLHQYIVKRSQEVDKEMSKIKENFKKWKEFQSSFSTQQAHIIKSNVIKQVQSIDLFVQKNVIISQVPIQTFSSQQPLLAQSNNLKQNQLIDEFPQKKQQQVELIHKIAQKDISYSEKEIDLLKHGQLECIPSHNFNQSKETLKIEYNNHQIIITNIQSSITWRQCYLQQQLQTNKKYIIQVSLNNQYNNGAGFCFGLLDSQIKDSSPIYSNTTYYNQYDGGNCNSVLKGQLLHTTAKIIGVKKLEFRIHIQQKIFKISSPPSYENVAQSSNHNLLDANKFYLFAIAICNPGDSVNIQKMLEVDSFNSQM